jgi:hypothetical protein
MNRLQMVLAATAIVVGGALSLVSPYFLVLPLVTVVIRLLTYGSRLRKVRGRVRFAVLGPLLDMLYSLGFLQGMVASAVGKRL